MVTIRELRSGANASTSNAMDGDEDENLSLPSINDDDESDDSDREVRETLLLQKFTSYTICRIFNK